MEEVLPCKQGAEVRFLLGAQHGNASVVRLAVKSLGLEPRYRRFDSYTTDQIKKKEVGLLAPVVELADTAVLETVS